MNIRLKRIATVMAVSAGLLAPLAASAAVVTSTVMQSSNSSQQTNASETALIGSFSFMNPATTIADITGVQITLTIDDGDTAFGNFDWNNLFLTLDGYSTGLALNGFANQQVNTNAISLSVPSLLNASSIYAALIADSLLVASVADLDGDVGGDNNGTPGYNQLKFPRSSVATLELTGDAAVPVSVNALNPNAVPEPGSLALMGLGIVGMAASRRRKRT